MGTEASLIDRDSSPMVSQGLDWGPAESSCENSGVTIFRKMDRVELQSCAVFHDFTRSRAL